LGVEAAIVVVGAAVYTGTARKWARAVESGHKATEVGAAMRRYVSFIVIVGVTLSLPHQPQPLRLDWPKDVSLLVAHFAAAWFAGSLNLRARCKDAAHFDRYAGISIAVGILQLFVEYVCTSGNTRLKLIQNVFLGSYIVRILDWNKRILKYVATL
jgi:hypothetical protein